ncbi:UDP-glucose/GDP-mannose dehydrogenase family protein, partial [Pseudotabrizicola algicola]
RKEGEALLPGVEWHEDAYTAAAEAECIVILTEWNQFRALDLNRLAATMKTPRLADLRNIYAKPEALAAGFKAYEGVGR